MLQKTLTKLPVSVDGVVDWLFVPIVYARGNYIYSADKEGLIYTYDGTKWNVTASGKSFIAGCVNYYRNVTIFEYNGHPTYMVPSNENTDTMVFKRIDISDTGAITFSDDPVATISESKDDPDYSYYQDMQATSWNGEIYVNKHAKLYKVSNGELEVVVSLPFKVGSIYNDRGDAIISEGDTDTIMMFVYNNELCMMSPDVGMWTFNGKRWKKLCDVPFVNTRGGMYNNAYAFYRDKLYVVDIVSKGIPKLHEFDGLTWKEITGTWTDNEIVPVAYNDELCLIASNEKAHYIYKEEIIMSNAVKNATFTTMVEGVLTDLMLKTTAAQVEVSEGVTLATKIQDLITAINGKSADGHIHATADVTGLDDKLATLATTEAMNTAISAAIDELIDGAPDTYDTLKEIATYISEHEEVVTALNAAIGNKADASVVTALSEKVTALEGSNHTHDNKSVLDSIIGADYSTVTGGPSYAGSNLQSPHTYIDDELKAYMDPTTLDRLGYTNGMPTLKINSNAIDNMHGSTEYLANLSTLKALAAGIDKKKADKADLGTLASKSAVSAAELDETLTAEVAKIHEHTNITALDRIVETEGANMGIADYFPVANTDKSAFGGFSTVAWEPKYGGKLMSIGGAGYDILVNTDLEKYSGALKEAFIDPAVTKITALEGKAHEHSNKSILDDIRIGENAQMMGFGPFTAVVKGSSQINGNNHLMYNYKKYIDSDEVVKTAIVTSEMMDVYHNNVVAYKADAETVTELSDKVTALETASGSAQKTYISATQPEGLKNGDLWINIAE